MTRLQRMFIQLSQYKTVEELEKATSEQFIDDLLAHLAFDDDGKVQTCGHFPHCRGCAIGCTKFNSSPRMLTIEYLNTEIDGSHPDPERNSIIILRDRALESLKKIFDKSCAKKLNPLVTGILLDSYCNMLENIGLFEPNECHDMLIKATKERPKK